MPPKLNLIVLRAPDPEAIRPFYEGLGVTFCTEKHGAGPEHLAADLGGSILEIYPCTRDASGTTATRLGFCVQSIEATLERTGGHCDILSAPEETPYGRRAVVRDRVGHKVELTETP